MCYRNYTNVTITKEFGPLNTREWLLVTAFSLVFMCGVFGNSLVIYIFGYKKKSLHSSSTEKLIFYLAVIDFFASIFNPLLFVYLTITRYVKWHFGYIGCKVLPAFGPITTTASAGMLLLFAVDRYRAIVSPFQGELSPKSISIVTIIIIIVSILSNVHYVYSIEVTERYGCRVPSADNMQYGVPNCTITILRVFLFFIVFTYTHAQIFRTLKRRNRCSPFGHDLAKQREFQSKQIIRCIFIMGIVHLLLVCPRDIMYLIYNLSWLVSTCGIRFSKEVVLVNVLMKFLQVSNSCANVFIYSHMHVYYRKHLFKVLRSLGLSGSRMFQIIQSCILPSMEPSHEEEQTKVNFLEDTVEEEGMDENKEDEEKRLFAEHKQSSRIAVFQNVDGNHYKVHEGYSQESISSASKTKNRVFFKRMKQYTHLNKQKEAINL